MSSLNDKKSVSYKFAIIVFTLLGCGACSTDQASRSISSTSVSDRIQSVDPVPEECDGNQTSDDEGCKTDHSLNSRPFQRGGGR